jgi:copper chaperone CopZ
MQENPKDLSEMEQVALDIVTCSCDKNINKIKRILKNTKGVVQSQVHYQPPQAVVFFDSTATSLQSIIKALDESGFVVGNVTRSSYVPSQIPAKGLATK